jgi:8-oxo-dGTP pyrophosphatase MutT (NUDIX family)
MSARDARMPAGLGRIRIIRPSTKFVRLSDLRKWRGSEQVAAVCYRLRNRAIEFLLVRTRRGLWTFPKGGMMAGLTPAQAAALEAFEEAGVHGRMEEEAFARYIRTKRAGRRDRGVDVAVSAHLCEVLRRERPQEAGRNPSWFSIEKTKRRLREDRSSDHSSELLLVVDRAVQRIQRSHQPTRALEGPRKVLFIDMKKIRLLK